MPDENVIQAGAIAVSRTTTTVQLGEVLFHVPYTAVQWQKRVEIAANHQIGLPPEESDALDNGGGRRLVAVPCVEMHRYQAHVATADADTRRDGDATLLRERQFDDDGIGKR